MDTKILIDKIVQDSDIRGYNKALIDALTIIAGFTDIYKDGTSSALLLQIGNAIANLKKG